MNHNRISRGACDCETVWSSLSLLHPPSRTSYTRLLTMVFDSITLFTLFTLFTLLTQILTLHHQLEKSASCVGDRLNWEKEQILVSPISKALTP